MYILRKWRAKGVIGSQSEIKLGTVTLFHPLVKKLICELLGPEFFQLAHYCVQYGGLLWNIKKQRQGWYPDESRCKSQIWIVSNRQYAVEVPFKKPNCFGSVSSLISFINHVTTFWYCPYERKPELQNIPFKKDPRNWAAHFDSMLKKASFLFCILWFCKYY